MRTAPASGVGTGCTPHRTGYRFRHAGGVHRRTGPRSARTGAACCGGRTPGSPGPARLPGAAVRPAGQGSLPPRQGRPRGGRGPAHRHRRRPAARSRPPGQAGHHVRPAGMIAFGAQVDHRGTPGYAGGSASRRTGARPARHRPPRRVFRCAPARGPQLPRRGIQPVQVRVGGDLVHPRRREPRRGRQRADGDPSARAKTSARLRSRSACSRRHAARDTRSSTRRCRRQAAIRSVIVTLTPRPCQAVFSKLDGLTRFPAPLLPAPPGCEAGRAGGQADLSRSDGCLAGACQSLGSVRGSPKRASSPRSPHRVSTQTWLPRSVSTTRLWARQSGVQGSAK